MAAMQFPPMWPHAARAILRFGLIGWRQPRKDLKIHDHAGSCQFPHLHDGRGRSHGLSADIRDPAQPRRAALTLPSKYRNKNRRGDAAVFLSAEGSPANTTAAVSGG